MSSTTCGSFNSSLHSSFGCKDNSKTLSLQKIQIAFSTPGDQQCKKTITFSQSFHSNRLINRVHKSLTSTSVKYHRNSRIICKAESSGGFMEAFSPKKTVEIDSLPPLVRDSTIKAVEDLGRRVTIGDVAARAGIKVSEAEKALRALASDTNGFLEVSDEGDVLYVMPRDFKSILVQKSVKLKLEPIWSNVKFVLEYLSRVAFGTALLTSIAVTYAAIAVILTSARSEDNNRNNRGGGYYAPQRGPGFFIDFSNLFWYWDPFYSQRVRMRRPGQNPSFFESVFSFVFGDGDPNEGIEEQRWRLIGDFIARRGGVVVSEELAPYLDPPALDASQGPVTTDEAFMLPVMQRFDGHAEVDEQGNILYRFPSLQRTATDWLGRKRIQIDEEVKDGSYFSENKGIFSQTQGGQRLLAVGLGGLNLVGVIALSSLLRDPQIVRQLESGVVSFAAQALPFLQAYAASFFAIPGIRWWFLQRRNAKVEERNRIRSEWAEYVMRQVPAFLNKRKSALREAESTVIGSDRVIYTTEKPVMDQEIEGDEWERRLKEREGSRSTRG